MTNITYTFSAPLWRYGGDNSWYFITIPAEAGHELAQLRSGVPGFGSVKVEVRYADTSWSTSVFPDKASGSYVLPVKQPIRSKYKLSDGTHMDITIVVQDKV